MGVLPPVPATQVKLLTTFRKKFDTGMVHQANCCTCFG